MATLTRGTTFTTTCTADLLHQLVDNGAVSNIVSTDISNGAITETKVASLAITAAKINYSGSGKFKPMVLNTNATSALNVIGGPSVDWTDLDLTSSTSANATAALVYAYFRDTVPTTGTYLLLRPNGSTDTNGRGVFSTSTYGVLTTWIPLDSGQIIEYKVAASGANTATYQIFVLGYMEDLA